MSTIKQEHDEKDADEYEDMYVYMDFGANLPNEELNGDNLQIKMIGTSTEHPIVQVNSRFFKGTYDYPLGTLVFFNESDTKMPTDSNFQKDPTQSYQFVCKTNKVLQMKRVFVAPKDGDEADMSVAIDAIDDLSKYEVHHTYSEALSHFLKPGQPAPRVIEPNEDGHRLVVKPTKKRLGSDMEMDDDPADKDYVPEPS